MKRPKDLLQDRLEQLERGEPLEICLQGLPEEEAALLKMAARIQAMDFPARKRKSVAAQRKQLLRAAQEAQRSAAAKPASRPEARRRPRRSWLFPAAAISSAAALLLVCTVIGSLAAGYAWLKLSPRESPLAQVSTPTLPSSEIQETRSPTPAPVALVAPDPQRAVLSEVRGLVEVATGDGTWYSVEPGTIIEAGQRLRTQSLSSATLAFYDGSQAHLGPNTEISLDALDARRSGETRTVLLTQWIGESDHDVVPSEDPDSRYEVRTPSGSGVAKGTSFHVLVTTNLMARFSVDEGSVAVTSLQVTVVIVAGQSTTIQPGEAPEDPTFLVSGEGEVGGTGGTWRIARHPFLTNSRTVIIGDPQIGDWVWFEGRILVDGTRFADRIVLLRRAPENRFQFRGRVEAMGDTEWTVSGRALRIDPTTAIDADIALGDLVDVKGFILPDGAFSAERIRRLEAERKGRKFEFVGVVDEAGEGGWKVAGIDLAVDADTEIHGEPVVGDVVEVEGYLLTDGTWWAKSIKLAQEDREFEVAGTVESIDPWVVEGISLEIKPWTEIDEGIAVGDRVKVEGRVLEDGTWLAEEIEGLDEKPLRFKFVGQVTSLDPWIVGGTTLAVDERTEIEGPVAVGDIVKVEGWILADGTWLAKEIELREGTQGCLNTRALVRDVSANQIVLLNWQAIELDDDVEVEGKVEVATVVVVQVCASDDGSITVVSITVIYHMDELPPPRHRERNEHDDDDDHDEHHHDEDHD